MKLLAMTALMAALAGSAHAQEVDRAAEYRMWSAEQMISRIVEKQVRAHKVCDRADWYSSKISAKCNEAVIKATPIFNTIREVAMDGDPIRWAELVDIVHKFEAEIEAPLNSLERK